MRGAIMEKGPSTFAQYWTSEYSLFHHFDEHGAEMGYDEDEIIEYARDAIKFARSSERGIKAFRATNDSIYKYNPKTNEFIIITKDGKIVTYYYPSNGIHYFEDRYLEYCKNWIL